MWPSGGSTVVGESHRDHLLCVLDRWSRCFSSLQRRIDSKGTPGVNELSTPLPRCCRKAPRCAWHTLSFIFDFQPPLLIPGRIFQHAGDNRWPRVADCTYSGRLHCPHNLARYTPPYMFIAGWVQPYGRLCFVIVCVGTLDAYCSIFGTSRILERAHYILLYLTPCSVPAAGF